MNRKLQPLLLVILVFVAASCSKKIVTVPRISSSALAVEEIDFEYLEGKARMVFKDDSKEGEVKANIRVRKDSVIWMNFSVIGLQGGRVLINKDSITIINNVNKEYRVFDFKSLSEKLHIDVNYGLIQSALLGNLLFSKHESDSVEQKSATFLLRQSSGTVEVLNFISAATMKIQKVELRESDTYNALTLNYGNFQRVANKLFPYDCTINVFCKTQRGVLNTSIMFEYTKADVGTKELKFPFSIPKKYERK
jgi:hypothetical protein